MAEIDKHASRDWRSHLRAVLNRDWDPIGVTSGNDLDDEYECYVGKVAAMLRNGASDEELLAYLKWAEIEHMGLGSEDQFETLRKQSVVQVIAALRKVGPPP